nr:hypothetical protein [Clostridia bacterium]
DIHDNPDWFEKHSDMPSIDVKVDVIEALGSETLLYCKTRSEDSSEEKSIAEDISNLVAKVGSRSTTAVDTVVKVGLDMGHCHLFDKETEITLLATDQANKAAIEELQAKREEEETAKAAAAAEKQAQEDAKAAAEIEKRRRKMEKKASKTAPKEEETSTEDKAE